MTNTQFEKMMAELKAIRADLERAAAEGRDEVDPAPPLAGFADSAIGVVKDITAPALENLKQARAKGRSRR